MPLPLACLTLLTGGLVVGFHLPPTLAHWAPALTVAALAAAALARQQALSAVPAACLSLAVVAAAAWHGSLAVARAEQPPLVRWLDQRVGAGGWATRAGRMERPVRLRGRLLRDASPGGSGVQLALRVSAVSAGGGWEAAAGGVALTVGGDLAADRLSAWRAGRLIEAPAQLRRPARYLNEGVTDGSRVLARRGTPLVGSVKSAALVDVVANGAPWDEGAGAIRAAVRRAMARRVAPRDSTAAAIGTAILIGDRAQMSAKLERRLQDAGTYHVVAISGGNIAMLAAAVLALLWMVGIRFRGAALTAAVVLLAHGWVIGVGASVIRATVMAVMYLALRVLDQRTAPVNAVAVGAGLMLLANPLDLLDAGFWLTFGATVALLASAAVWRPARAPRWWQAPLVVCAGTLAVEVVLLPVSALVFQRVTLAGLVANLGAVPAMGFVQGAASVCVLADVAGIGWLADLAGCLTQLAARLLVESSRVVDVAPWSTWRVPSPSPWVIGGYYALLVAWWGVRRSGGSTSAWCRAAAGTSAAVLWGWMAMAPQTRLPRPAEAPLSVSALDVGQGDALLVRFPNGRTLMVDAGGVPTRGDFDIGDRVVGPALRARGLGRLDYLAVTHGDVDHAGGAAALVRDFRPLEVWLGVPVAANPPEIALNEAARAARSAVRWLQAGDRLVIAGVEVRVHHPPLPDWERQRVRNDDSLVMELRHGVVSVLLTGDVGREVEQALLTRLDLPPIVILKAPHHGSATSSSAAFLAGTRPAAVLVSAGRANLFGHPAPAVIERYAGIGAAVFRTDRDGQIDVTTNGRAVEIRSVTGLRWRFP